MTFPRAIKCLGLKPVRISTNGSGLIKAIIHQLGLSPGNRAKHQLENLLVKASAKFSGISLASSTKTGSQLSTNVGRQMLQKSKNDFLLGNLALILKRKVFVLVHGREAKGEVPVRIYSNTAPLVPHRGGHVYHTFKPQLTCDALQISYKKAKPLVLVYNGFDRFDSVAKEAGY